MRKKCLSDGHKFREIVGVPLPYNFCKRWGCGASAVSRNVGDLGTAVSLHNAIPREDRVPPVELSVNGDVIEQWEEGKPNER